MDEWFKARLIWLDGIEALSDAEAGRFVKALWRYAATGETVASSGGEKFALATCIATLRQDAAERTKLSETRSRSGSQGGRPKGSGKANESKKSICTHIRNKNKDIIPLTPLQGDDDDDLLRTQEEHNEVLDAAGKAGFPTSDAMMSRLVDLYAEHGKDKLLAAIDCCVEHNAVNLAYLRAVLKDKPKPEDEPYDWMADLRSRGIGV
jgi:hypothetical protein